MSKGDILDQQQIKGAATMAAIVAALRADGAKVTEIVPPGGLWSAEYKNKAVLGIDFNTGSGIVYLSGLYVPPELRGKGVADRIMRLVVYAADISGGQLGLVAEPTMDEGPTRFRFQVFHFFQKYGFVSSPGIVPMLMERHPEAHSRAFSMNTRRPKAGAWPPKYWHNMTAQKVMFHLTKDSGNSFDIRGIIRYVSLYDDEESFVYTPGHIDAALAFRRDDVNKAIARNPHITLTEDQWIKGANDSSDSVCAIFCARPDARLSKAFINRLHDNGRYDSLLVALQRWDRPLGREFLHRLLASAAKVVDHIAGDTEIELDEEALMILAKRPKSLDIYLSRPMLMMPDAHIHRLREEVKLNPYTIECLRDIEQRNIAKAAAKHMASGPSRSLDRRL